MENLKYLEEQGEIGSIKAFIDQGGAQQTFWLRRSPRGKSAKEKGISVRIENTLAILPD